MNKVVEKDIEKDYLKACIEVIHKNIDKFDIGMNIDESNIMNLKRYFWENINSMDKQEILSLEDDINIRTNIAMQNYHKAKVLKRMLNSPYFGSFNFISDDNEIDERVYVGISSVIDKFDIYIYDWRTPIGGLYYEHSGRVSYEAPKMIVHGLMSSKRQYKIEDGKMLYMLENDLNITDDILQNVLSQNTSDKMKNIVNTIQKDQNEIIRDLSTDVLIIQGIAGSGKTSVALHRIAYLLYKMKEQLGSSNIIIFSPNDVFTNYISDVLPSLGEDNVIQTTFSQYSKVYINEFKTVQSYFEYLESLYENNYNEDYKNYCTFKMSEDFMKLINDYVNELVSNAHFTDNLVINDYLEISKEKLNIMLNDRYIKQPLFERLDLITDKICETKSLKGKRIKISIRNKLKKIININIDFKKLYKSMYDSSSFELLNESKYNLKYIKQRSNQELKGKKISYLDSIGLLYLKGLLEGFQYTPIIKQVVIDEAQDYNITQFEIFKQIFKTAKFTILGDFNQMINYVYNDDTLSLVDNLFKTIKSTKYIKLDKTYRSSLEITNYVNKILGLNNINVIRRSTGIAVKESTLPYNDMVNEIKNKIHDMQKKEYRSIAIICKNNNEATELYESLKDELDISLIDNFSEQDLNGTFIIPSYLSKGLEFDGVLVSIKKDNPYHDYEKKLYYVVCTRALHELVIVNEK